MQKLWNCVLQGVKRQDSAEHLTSSKKLKNLLNNNPAIPSTQTETKFMSKPKKKE